VNCVHTAFGGCSQLFKCSILCLTTPLHHAVGARNDERMKSDFFLNIFTQELFIISSSCDVVYEGRWLTKASYWFILRFCAHFTCLRRKIQNAIKLFCNYVFFYHLFWQFTFGDPQNAHIHSIDTCRPWITGKCPNLHVFLRIHW
jgi:hypothetical protein